MSLTHHDEPQPVGGIPESSADPAPTDSSANPPASTFTPVSTIHDTIEIILEQIFSNTDVNADTIKRLREGGRVVRYPDSTVLCHEGEIESTFYVLIDGQADVFRTIDGETHHVDRLLPGTGFGEIALILNSPRTADVIAHGEIRVLEIDRESFNTCIRDNPNGLLAVAQLVIQRMLTQEQRRLVQLSLKVKHESARGTTAFISYARADEVFARKLSVDLRKSHIATWLDVQDIEAGKSWARQIGEALDRCAFMVLLLSPESVQSTHVEDEWNYYLDKGKAILPVLLRPCDVPYRLHKLQYVDFATSPYLTALNRLIANLRLYIAPPE